MIHNHPVIHTLHLDEGAEPRIGRSLYGDAQTACNPGMRPAEQTRKKLRKMGNTNETNATQGVKMKGKNER